MKRSEINKVITDALGMFEEYKISLPDFANYSPEEWKQKGESGHWRGNQNRCACGWKEVGDSGLA